MATALHLAINGAFCTRPNAMMPDAMMTDRVIEPLGLLHGTVAAEACAAGAARPLAGGPAAFSLAALIGIGPRRIVPAATIPDDWAPLLARLTAPPATAGLPPGPLVMGILNRTPDSFSDGGRHVDLDRALAAARAMLDAGADLLDIGGESTRPGARPVPPEEEQARVLPLVRALAGQGALVSVDTRNASTMRAALDAGALLVNDVSALAHDPAARGVLSAASCPVVLMHMRGTPETMQSLTGYGDVAVDVLRELAERIGEAERAGIDRARLLVDPGIGFAKTEDQNLQLLRRLPILAGLGCRVLLGVSRKGFVGRVGGAPLATERFPGSIAAALPALSLPGSILRVHDVAETVQAVRLWQAIHG